MRGKIIAVLLLVAMFVGGYSRAAPGQDMPTQAVLVAGDGSLPVFDNAVRRMAEWLHSAAGLMPRQIVRLSGAAAVIARDGAQSATQEHVVDAIARLQPPAGQSCFVFITSHGVHHHGVYLEYDDQVLSPTALDRALRAGCGNAPTVAIVSACYSGGFAQPPMARRNRIILTAARADRPSFGCDTDETYTFFDECLLASLGHGPEWRDLFRATRLCVARHERAGG